MDELITPTDTAKHDLPAAVPEIYLGTVYSWTNNGGVRVTLDGQTEPMQKGYKQLLVSRPLQIGARVALIKTSGTYFVLGEVANPVGTYGLEHLAYTAALSDVIMKVNLILSGLESQGVFRIVSS